MSDYTPQHRAQESDADRVARINAEVQAEKEPTVSKLAPYYKAIVAFVTPGVASLVIAVQDASPGGSAVTGPEWVGIGAACILTGGLVYSVPNKVSGGAS